MNTKKTVLERSYNHVKPEIYTLTRSRRRFTPPHLTEVVIKMSKRTFKFYEHICESLMITLTNFVVLDTGAGPNLVRRNYLHGVPIKSSDKPVIINQNGPAPNILAITALFAIFVKYVVILDFCVC